MAEGRRHATLARVDGNAYVISLVGSLCRSDVIAPLCQLKKQFGIMKSIKLKSGWPWHETCGAADVPQDAWEDFIVVSLFFL